ncbi:adenylate cyclase type 3-like [Tachypleus tridentatus]|uniref:adenylate cyclase type 3-like n=1 Tax=Tachypleus tridentatus TaxID=6853 RepID=UPI003FD65511
MSIKENRKEPTSFLELHCKLNSTENQDCDHSLLIDGHKKDAQTSLDKSLRNIPLAAESNSSRGEEHPNTNRPLKEQTGVSSKPSRGNLPKHGKFISCEILPSTQKHPRQKGEVEEVVTLRRYSAPPNGIKHVRTMSFEKAGDYENQSVSSRSPATKRHSLLHRGDTSLSLDNSGFQRCLPQCMRFVFADHEAERLYKEYYQNEKRNDFKLCLAVIFLVDLVLLCFHSYLFRHSRIYHLIALVLVGLVDVGSFLVYNFKDLPSWIWIVIPFVAWFLQIMQVLCDMWIYHVPIMPSDSVPWVLLYSYLIYVLFPVRLRVCIILGVVMTAFHLLLVVSSPGKTEYMGNQVGANLFLFFCVNVLGVVSFFFAERQQRQAFLETRQSLEAKLILEEESQEQERLLLSVLPQHLAAEIRQDLGAVVTGQFKKIYMSRHENVSILFADIVGFTAISSTCPAAELVRTLNELFARFDNLAEKYHQLRIKILGDCYYCISGAPEERPDHAVLCVHMGLSMVDAIRSVREETRSTVDMRVGIHTGGVLAGVLGQRQWQFDVYSRDVELANKLESSGLPGRVHISDKTLSFLNDEFEIIPADGASREETIKLAGIKTYLIVGVLKPYPSGTLDGAFNKDEACVTTKEEECYKPRDVRFDVRSDEEYKERLHRELLSRESDRNIWEHSRLFTLRFKSLNLERQYRGRRAITIMVSMAGFLLVISSCDFADLVLVPETLAAFQTTGSVWAHLGIPFITVCILLLTMLKTYTIYLPKFELVFFRAAELRPWVRIVSLLILVTVWIGLQTLKTIRRAFSWPEFYQNYSELNLKADKITIGQRDGFPQYLIYYCVTMYLGLTTFTHTSHLIKLAITVTITAIWCTVNNIPMKAMFEWYDFWAYGSRQPIGHRVYLSVVLVTISIAVITVNRQLELTSRRLFMWKKAVEEQKEKVADMRRKNEALVYNILPPHVAKHFLGRRKMTRFELYSKSYSAVGVLFAAMPNFSDFYTEESVNNQGLECLRFLNEVISDYDALLEQQRFKDIIKIKTIGSTYMAASGLNNEESTKPNIPVKEKWRHLADLTEFALTLKETLSNINRESFNNFVLRMGINQGPITAGVIGARKPHYDMWGNTVNVASRMESTGKAGCIQIVEATAAILREFGYLLHQRGLVSVKGKGKLMTYYVIGKKPENLSSEDENSLPGIVPEIGSVQQTKE